MLNTENKEGKNDPLKSSQKMSNQPIFAHPAEIFILDVYEDIEIEKLSIDNFSTPSYIKVI